MSKKNKKKEDESQQLEAQLKRALADYANLQRRVEEERKELGDYFKSIFAVKFLPVLDSIEAALKTEKSGGSNTPAQGLELSVDQFRKILQELGVEEIDAKGTFDPQVHEAVEVVPGKASNKIVDVVEKGYKLGDKILRPAKVRVEKKNYD